MSYDYINYRRRQYDLPQPAQPFCPYQPVQLRRATRWDPPDSRNPQGFPSYDQPSHNYRAKHIHRTPMSHQPTPLHHMGSVQTCRPSCCDPPGNQPLQSFEPYDPPQSRQPSCWEPPPSYASRGYLDYDQPPLGPPSRWDPPDYRYQQTLQPTHSDRPLCHRTAPLPAVAPPRSGFTHPPQQSSRFIDSEKQRGLPNIPSLKVCSLAQPN